MKCEYCGQKIGDRTEKALHIEHEHPLMMKCIGTYGYFEALQVRYSRRK